MEILEMGNEGLQSEKDAILTFLQKEKREREARIHEQTQQKKHPTPIKAYDRPQNILHGNKEPKQETLEEIWVREDSEAKERAEEEEYRKWAKRKR